MKIIYLVLDGAAGDPSLGKTAYMEANLKNLDMLAGKGLCGLVYTVKKGVAPESDAAVLSILGYDPEKEYTGRGPLEALGLGLTIKEGYEVAFRGNFATIDASTGRIIDRRVGRSLSSPEAAELASSIDGLELDGGKGYARVKASIGHRVSVIIGHKEHRLSDNVGNTDPAYERKGRLSVSLKEFHPYIKSCQPLENRKEASITCRLVDEFTRKAISILENHPVNLERAKKGLLQANAVLLRDAGGKQPRLKPLTVKFPGFKFKAMVEMPVEAGIARASGMEVVALPQPTGDYERDYKLRAEYTLRALEENAVVYVHLKGPDEPGHDGDIKRKKEILELIDRYYVGAIIEALDEDTGLIVTSDHATPCQLRGHSDAPVPLLVYRIGLDPDASRCFNEIECQRGSLGVLPSGRDILPKSLRILVGEVV